MPKTILFSLISFFSGDKASSRAPLNQQLVEVQEALAQLNAQVQKIKESLHTASGKNNLIINNPDSNSSVESEMPTLGPDA